jgi:AsmA protein
VDLRPGGDLDKQPGQPLTVAAKGTFSRKGGDTHLDLDELKVDIQQAKLTGNAKVDLAGKTTAVVAQLESPRLDLDKLLYTAPKPPPGAPPQPPPPPKDPHRLDGLRVDANVKVGQLHVEDMDLQNVRLELSMVDDVVTIKKLTTGFYGGEVVADGTSIHLGPPKAQRPFHAVLKVKDVDLQAAIGSQTQKKWLSGRFTGDVAMDGVGTQMTALSQTMGGTVDGKLNDGKLLGVDVLSAATGVLAKALPFAGQAIQGANLTELGKELPIGITIDHGVAQLKRPISYTRPEGSLSLEGGARLDGNLDLAGTLQLSPETISKLTRGKVVPREAFPLPLKITGPVWKPNVAVVDLQTPVRALAKLAATTAATKLLGDKFGDKGNQVADIINGDGDAKQKAEAAAREAAEQAKKRLEEEAKKRLQNLFGGH